MCQAHGQTGGRTGWSCDRLWVDSDPSLLSLLLLLAFLLFSSRLLEGLDASIGGVDRTCKVDLSEFIPVDSKARGYRLKDSTAKSERSVSTTMSKASPAPRALSQRSLSQTRSHSHTFRSPANSPLRRNETRLHPRTPVRNSSVVAHEEQPSAMEIDDVDEDQPLLKDEIED